MAQDPTQGGPTLPSESSLFTVCSALRVMSHLRKATAATWLVPSWVLTGVTERMSVNCQVGLETTSSKYLTQEAPRATAEPLWPRSGFAADCPQVGVLCPSLRPGRTRSLPAVPAGLRARPPQLTLQVRGPCVSQS